MSKPIDQERALFEAAILKVWPSCPVHVVRDLLPPDDPQYGAYVDQDIRAAWVGWQARAQLPAGGEVPKLNKTREQWERVDSRFCAENNSPAANMHLIKDAQQDIARLHRALAAAPHPVSGEQKHGSFDKDLAMHLLSEAHGFASVSPRGKDNIATVMEMIERIDTAPAAQDVAGLCELIDDVREWFELRGLHELNIYKALKEANRAQAQGGSK